MAINEVLSALADETRRTVLQKLREGKINSGDLAKSVGLSPQALSYHLAKLRKSGLIYETKEKNFIFYELDLTVLDEAIVWISTLKGEKNDER